jgi:DNA modification methylase
MRVKSWNIERIKPYANNPRINDHAVDAVVASIREFGFRQPIVVDTHGVIIVGHTRYKAALKLGLKKVPVHVATDMTPAQIQAYRIADNKTAENAFWDHNRLVQELAELDKAAFDLDLLGFSGDELQKLWGEEITSGLIDPDAIPQAPDAAVTKRGDLWILGEHRLYCGDAAELNDVDRLLDGADIHFGNLDPPYGVKVEPRTNNAIAAGHSSFERTKHHQSMARHPKKAKATAEKLRPRDRPLTNDFMSEAEFDRLLRAWFGNLARVLLPGRCFVAWSGYSNLANYPSALRECGLYFSQAIVWDKVWPVVGRKCFMGAYELAFFGWREGGAHQFFGPNNATDLWRVKKVTPAAMVHLTEKPVELAVRAIQYCSRPGENVVDLFGGSGSTLIAAEQTGRRAFLMEIDALYCDVIVRRFEQFTGQKAQRQSEGSRSRR